jgi:hypothetical protein
MGQFGLTGGAATPVVLLHRHQAQITPIFGRLPSIAFPWSVQVVLAANSMLGHWFAPSIWEWGIF